MRIRFLDLWAWFISPYGLSARILSVTQLVYQVLQNWDYSMFIFHPIRSLVHSTWVLLAWGKGYLMSWLSIYKTVNGSLRLWKEKAWWGVPVTRSSSCGPPRKRWKCFQEPRELSKQTFWVESSSNWGQPIKLMAWSQRCLLGAMPLSTWQLALGRFMVRIEHQTTTPNNWNRRKVRISTFGRRILSSLTVLKALSNNRSHLAKDNF